jgi:hypothetical protein
MRIAEWQSVNGAVGVFGADGVSRRAIALLDPLPAAHFERNDVIIICEAVH